MGPIILAAAGGLAWAWFTGRLKGVTSSDMIAGMVFLLGLRLLTTGKLIPGAVLMAGAILWVAHRRRQASKEAISVEEACRLLGVSETASLEDIRAAHRRLIAKVHPDAGGSDELAHRVNLARDTLVSRMNRKPPRAS